MNGPLLPALPGYDNPQLIAHGTTALVFRATQTRLNRSVAIKVIAVDTGSVPVNAERELATTVALSSQPHIVSIIDTGVTDDDRPYIVMEYCEGGSYAQILRHDGLLPVDDVLEVGVKIGEALHAAHQAGIVHRDVKPSNILRSRFGPALTDFGIARAPDELGGTLTREMMTPHHASPEALLHQAQSGISDIYSLASTMWTLLIGHPPFVDPTKPPLDMYAFRDRVLHDTLPPMTREDVPAWLVGELDRAMSKLPSARHGSALEFAEALRRGALGLSPARPSSAPSAAAGQASAPHSRPPSGGSQPAAPPSAVPPVLPPAPVAPAAVPHASVQPTSVAPTSVPRGLPAQAAPAPQAVPTPQAVPAPHGMPAQAAPAPQAVPSGRAAGIGATPAPAAAPRIPTRPEARPDLDEDEDEADQGGWLGPAREWRSTPDTPLPDLFSPGNFSPGTFAPGDFPPGNAQPGTLPPGAHPPGAHPAGNFAPGNYAPASFSPGTFSPDPGPPRRFADRDLHTPPRFDEHQGGEQSRFDEHDRGAQSRFDEHHLDARSRFDEHDLRGGSTFDGYDPLAPHRFDDSDLMPPPDRHRRILLAVLAGVAVLAVVGAGLLLATSRQPPSTADGPAVPSPTRFISAQTEGQPRDSRITEDRGTSVTVGWTDPTAGTVTFVVVGSGPAGEKLETKSVKRGTTTVTYNQLSAQKNYCFVVGAVYAVDTVALSAEVCTKR